MKHLVLTALLTLIPLSAAAEDGDVDRGLSLLEEGMGLMLEGLISEIEPRLSQLEDALDAFNAYHPPEVLPNGDILIRRRRPGDTVQPNSGGEI
ncbi:MAG: hypothetical protein AAFW64_04000 [Pseudomonadota bacterium]